MSESEEQMQCCQNVGELLEPRFFKALCDPNRIALLCRLAECREPCTVSQIAECCPVDLSVVSRHLAMLREAGIFEAEKRGKEVYYSVRTSALAGTLRAIADAIEACCPPTDSKEIKSRGEYEMSKTQTEDTIRQAVRETYGEAAKRGAGCGCAPSSCCDGTTQNVSPTLSSKLGYSEEELQSVPEGADMGLGCGNPQAIAALNPGETVLDLGSGGGFDCFLAARQVGEGGQVIGVDMTPEMISKARENAAKAGFANVEFRLGEIEHLPAADASVDVILSNCVINLSPDKPSVYREAYRILKPGGRLAISDVVATAPMPDEVKKDLALHAGCVAGAALIEELESMIQEAGFTNIRVTPKDGSRELIREWAPGRHFEDFVVSASIEAVKPE